MRYLAIIMIVFVIKKVNVVCIGRDYSDVMQRCSVLIGDSPAIGQDYTFWCLLGTLSDHKAFIQKFGCLGKRKITGSRLVCVCRKLT